MLSPRKDVSMGARLIAPYTGPRIWETKTFIFIERDVIVPNAPVTEWPNEKLIEFIDAWDEEMRAYPDIETFPLNDCAMTYFSAWAELGRRTAN